MKIKNFGPVWYARPDCFVDSRCLCVELGHLYLQSTSCGRELLGLTTLADSVTAAPNIQISVVRCMYTYLCYTHTLGFQTGFRKTKLTKCVAPVKRAHRKGTLSKRGTPRCVSMVVRGRVLICSLRRSSPRSFLVCSQIFTRLLYNLCSVRPEGYKPQLPALFSEFVAYY